MFWLEREIYQVTLNKVEHMTPTLAEGFARGNEFLHILVTDAPDQEVIIS